MSACRVAIFMKYWVGSFYLHSQGLPLHTHLGDESSDHVVVPMKAWTEIST